MAKRLLRKYIIYISKQLDRYPGLKKCLFLISIRMWQLWWRIRKNFVDKTVDWDKTLIIDPVIITKTVPVRINILKDKGKVIDGDWDLPQKGSKKKSTFEYTDEYKACCQRYLNNIKWEETEHYYRRLEDIDSGRTLTGPKSRDELNDYFQSLDLLYLKIKEGGYKTQRELKVSSRYSTSTEEDEITVSINRNGELLFTNGCHRLAIAKILGIKEVPVKVTVRHSEWINFRKQVIAYAASQGGKIYQPLTHPDLADIPSIYEGEDRFNIIRQNITAKTGTLLDIGSHWGYFCHKFEDEGFDCYAVENDPLSVYFLDKLRRAENKKFKVFSGSIFDFQERSDFEVVLALNIFHHFLKKKSSYLKLIELFKRLRIGELFFQTAGRDEPQMENAYKNYSNDEFVAFILEHSCLREARCIYELRGERLLYKLYQ